MIKQASKSLFVALLLLTSSNAFAWSSAGHKIIAQIAADNISASTKSQIAVLTDSEDMQKSAWWPDTVKSSSAWKHTKGYHYKDINDGVDYFESLKTASDYYKKKGDMIRALLKAEDMLRDPSESKTNKKNALRFLLHLVGDIHQPLHAGYQTDGGGNSVKVDWYGSARSLHSLWDGGLISTYAYKNNLPKETQTTSYADKLRKPSATEISQWTSNSYIYDWFQEALDVRDETYVGLSAESDIYYANQIELNNNRLLRAGYRLAHWLDGIFANAPLSAKAKKLRSDISLALGPSAQTVGEIHLTEQSTAKSRVQSETSEELIEADDCDHH